MADKKAKKNLLEEASAARASQLDKAEWKKFVESLGGEKRKGNVADFHRLVESQGGYIAAR